MTSDIHALSGAYAVDALDDDERRMFEQHLAECADCRDEVESLREASTLLAATTELEPPPSLRDAVLADIATVRPLPPQIGRTPAGSGTSTARPRRWPAMLAAAAAVAVLGGGAVVVWQAQDTSQTQQLSATERVLAADDAREVELELPDGAEARLVRSESAGKAVLVTTDMPAAPEGHDYQLWLQSPEGTMVPAGVMPDGADQEFLLDGDATEATAAGITVEPDGGSPAPTTEPIALFPFEQAT